MDIPQFETRTDLTALNNAVILINKELSKIIVGQKEMVQLLIVALLADGHVLIEGVPGVAKTLTAKLVAKSLATKFTRIQFTPDLMPSDIIGTPVFHPQQASFHFKKGPIFGNIILVDEVNRAAAKTQAALLEVMEERQVTVDGVSYLMENPFMVIATQNPIEQEGTYRLPEAQMDRFLFKIEVPYPNEEEEVQILNTFHQLGSKNAEQHVQAVLSGDEITQLKVQVKSILIEEHLISFIAQIVLATRRHKSIYLGASPRASLAIMNASKALAATMGRDFVTPDDIIFLAPHVLKHRIILSPEKEMEGVTESEVVKDILNSLEIPR